MAPDEQPPADVPPADTPPPADPPVEDPIIAQADKPDAVRNLIDAEREAARKEKERADALATKVAEFEDRDKSDQEKLEGRATSAEEKSAKSEQRAADAEQRYLRLKVGSEKGLPLSLAERLQGSDEDEMAADADRLLEDVKPSNRGSFDGGARPPAEPQVEPGLGRLAHAYSQSNK